MPHVDWIVELEVAVERVRDDPSDDDVLVGRVVLENVIPISAVLIEARQVADRAANLTI